MQYITVGDVKVRGQSKTKTKEHVQTKYWIYDDLPLDENKWCADKSYKPVPFDLCELEVKGRPKPVNGWWTGNMWDSIRKKPEEEVLKWRVRRELN